jgi:hypothetical protein
MANRKSPAHFAKQAQEAYELSLAGYSQRQIAEKMGIALLTVQKRLKLYIEDRVHPKADEYRNQQLDRARIYIRSLWSRVLDGDEKAINAAIRTEERIAKLLGLDSATQFVVTNTNEELPEDHPMRRMMESAKKAKEADRQEDIERAAQGLPALPPTGRPRARAKELEALEKIDSAFQERTGIEPPRRKPMSWELDATKPQAITPADEFASEPDATDEVPEGFEELGTPIPQPAPKRPRRGKPIPNPAHRFLRDSDDD